MRRRQFRLAAPPRLRRGSRSCAVPRLRHPGRPELARPVRRSCIESGARPEVHAPDGPGAYPGPFSAISPQAAAFVGDTPPVGYGAAPLELASSGGATLTKEGNVGGISVPEAAAFISPSRGWVVGETLPSGDFVVEATANGGHTWTRQYQARQAPRGHHPRSGLSPLSWIGGPASEHIEKRQSADRGSRADIERRDA
jgi:hypothetical protein